MSPAQIIFLVTFVFVMGAIGTLATWFDDDKETSE